MVDDDDDDDDDDETTIEEAMTSLFVLGLIIISIVIGTLFGIVYGWLTFGVMCVVGSIVLLIACKSKEK